LVVEDGSSCLVALRTSYVVVNLDQHNMHLVVVEVYTRFMVEFVKEFDYTLDN
jgi:hypothetical protein